MKHAPPLEEVERTSPSKRKDTKKWCKGKVGREHNYEWGDDNYGSLHYRTLRCLNCGKIKDIDFGVKPSGL